MKKGVMVFFFFLLWVLFSTNSLAFEAWVPFQPGSLEGYPEITILSSTQNGLSFWIRFPGMKVGEISKQGEIYHGVSIPGGGHTHNVGWAELPTWSRFVALPQGAMPEVEVVRYSSKILSGYNVFPAQKLPVDKENVPPPEFVKDAEFYSTDKFYPDRLAFAGKPKVIRGCQVLLLTLFPVQYNPAKGELSVVQEMEVKVNFVGGNGTFIDPRLRSPYFENLFENLLLNYPVLGRPSANGGKSATGCDFLIITHPNFQAWAESLAFWKNLSGIPTWVKNTFETGSDTGSIRTYIQNAYDTWVPPPSFLLLIGDAEYIPPFYRNTHPYDGFKTGTDLYYTTLDGPDFFPDIFPGRISVDNLSQAEVVIGKILQYERSPLSGETSFYDKVLVAGYFQDYYYPYDWEDRFFIKTSETVRDFLISHDYDVERCYTKTSGSNPCCYYYGDPLPPGLTWDGDATQIINAINDGVFLVNHRDHGSEEGWGDPYFVVSHVNSLGNGDKLPVVLSINCETGHFDNETDSPGHDTPVTAVYFCEAFQRKANGGAVGIFGHTRVSWSGLNDELCKGFYDAIFPDFDPSYPSGGSTHPIFNPMFRMGVMLNFGKFWTYDKYYLTGGAGYPWEADYPEIRATFEMGTWFGDPTMQIWTGYPETLNVSHSDTIPLGSYEFTVSVTSSGSPVESVLVCLMNDEVYEVSYTNGSGEADFSCSTTTPGSLYITASKHNFRPYQGSITVEEISFVLGDANGDGTVSVSDIVFLINYLYHGGPAPSPFGAGDVTCDGLIDLSDLVFLIDYLFREGPPPVC